MDGIAKFHKQVIEIMFSLVFGIQLVRPTGSRENQFL